MFEYRRNLRGDAAVPVKDFLMNATYAGTAEKGDVVKLNAGGEVVAAAANDTDILGVFVGPCIKMEKETDTFGKVQSAEGLIFEATVSGEGTPTVGGEHPIALADGDYTVNVGSTTTPVVKIVAVNEDRGTVDVVFTGLQIG